MAIQARSRSLMKWMVECDSQGSNQYYPRTPVILLAQSF